jgi:hydrogenase/urease accessory protein HupE
LFIVLLTLAGLPFVVVHPSGPASAGLSAGFLELFPRHPLRLLLLAPLGAAACFLRNDARLILPLSFVLMYFIGALLEMNLALYPMVRLFLLGAILTFALALNLTKERTVMAIVLLCASLAYHLGGAAMQSLPELASPLYFIMGQMLALALVLALAFSLGVLLSGEAREYRAAREKRAATAATLSVAA